MIEEGESLLYILNKKRGVYSNKVDQGGTWRITTDASFPATILNSLFRNMKNGPQVRSSFFSRSIYSVPILSFRRFSFSRFVCTSLICRSIQSVPSVLIALAWGVTVFSLWIFLADSARSLRLLKSSNCLNRRFLILLIFSLGFC
jgi:hypothetical protein